MKALVLAVLALFSEVVLAGDDEFQVGLKVGVSRQDIDSEATVTQDGRRGFTGIGLGATAGYVTPFGLLIEAGAAWNSNSKFGSTDENGGGYNNTFDEYEFTNQTLVVGYQFETANGFRITPKVGRMRWKLHAKEGELANPGPETSTDYRGYDYYWELALTKTVGKNAAWGIVLQNVGFDYGRERLLAFTAAFRL